MSDRVIVVGGGVGGLAAGITLARAGAKVTVCEASSRFGGLASALEAGGTRFDGGPYILLDPAGLAWAFEQLGLDPTALGLRRVEDVYVVERDGAPPVHVYSDLERTCAGLDAHWPGQGERYRTFLRKTAAIHRALAPLQVSGSPGPMALVRAGVLRHAPFLLESLGRLLRSAGFVPAVADAIGIWTHVAGQNMHSAPSPLGLVPAMIHGPGCFVPARGLAAIPELVLGRAAALGVELRASARVRRIVSEAARVTGVELEDGTVLSGRAVISDASGVATLLELADAPVRVKTRVAALPLQSPGVAAYVLAEQEATGPYLRFRLHPEQLDAPCRLIVRPSALPGSQPSPAARAGGARGDGRHLVPTRIVAPLAHEVAERLGEAGQMALLDSILAEPWVRDAVGPFTEVARLVPASWGRRHVLHRDSMNPVMTAKFMRQGRLPHRVESPDGLFLVGSSTHPGQWVSFCLASGVIGARAALERLARIG